MLVKYRPDDFAAGKNALEVKTRVAETMGDEASGAWNDTN